MFRAVAPLAGAWIEILSLKFFFRRFGVAPLAGAWIEIPTRPCENCTRARRTPHGVRGLKFH